MVGVQLAGAEEISMTLASTGSFGNRVPSMSVVLQYCSTTVGVRFEN